jgi:hypothetical protein
VSVIIDEVEFDEAELDQINVNALSKEERKNLVALQRGWLAYKANPLNETELKAVLHGQIVWHELNGDAGAGDYNGEKVMEHFRKCKANFYNDVISRVYEEVKQDHAVVRDILVTHNRHECLDVYRLEDNKVIEMWTCVTHPVHEAGVKFTTRGHAHQ